LIKIEKKYKSKNHYRLILLSASILYSIFGTLYISINTVDPMGIQHRIILSTFFFGLFIFSYLFKFVKDNLKTIVHISSFLAIFDLIYLAHISNYDYSFSVSIIVVIGFVNLLYETNKVVLYSNLITALLLVFSLFTTNDLKVLISMYVGIYIFVALFSLYISYRKSKIENKLKIREKQYRTIFDKSPVGMMIEDAEGNIIKVNRRFCEITGFTKEQLEGSTIFDTLVPPERHEKARENIDQILSGNDLEFVLENHKPNREKNHIKLKETKIYIPEKGEGIISMQIDITPIKQKEKKLEFMSYHDKLTEVYNRNYFEEKLVNLDSKDKLPLSLILVDVNGLKLINDTYGHYTGDQFIIKTSQILKSVFRTKDVIARIGGDEFGIILPNTTIRYANQAKAKILEKAMNTPINGINLSIGIGSSTKNNAGENIYEVFKKADKNMYRDKLTKSRSMKNKLINNLLNTLGAKSQETKEHSIRMKKLALKLGKELDLNAESLNNLNLLSTLHDIGKVTISEKILNKNGKLTDKEWDTIKSHSTTGFNIISSIDDFAHIAKYILYHHERWDGNGYPEGLKNSEIPLMSRIISIIDAYDVMTNDRIYSKAITKEKALHEIKECSGTQFDPKIAETFISILK